MPSGRCLWKRRLRKRLHEAQDGKCFWCGCQMTFEYKNRGSTPRKNFCTIDHVFTRGDPRRHDAELAEQISTHVGACYDCNNKRGNTPFEEFKRRMDDARDTAERAAAP